MEEIPELPLRNPAHKIIAVAAGEAHTLALSGIIFEPIFPILFVIQFLTCFNLLGICLL